jgi:hypothetical protein
MLDRKAPFRLVMALAEWARPAQAYPGFPPFRHLYWLLGTSVRKIANFTFSPSLFACHVKLERGKSKDVLLALPNKNLKHTRKIGACFEIALRKDVPKRGERASTGIFAPNSFIGIYPDHPLSY